MMFRCLRAVQTSISVVVLACLSMTAAWAQAPARAGAAAPLKFRLTISNPFVARIDDVKADGSVLISQQPGGPGGAPDLIEGLYLGLAMAALKLPFENASLVRAQVVDVGSNGTAAVRVGKQAATAMRAGQLLILVRPAGTTTAEMKRTPDLAALQTDDAKGGAGGELVTSMNNLKQIALALHNFHDVHGRFPPAAIIGPDGRPWHSWRVLILPFLEQQPIYDQYKFDEPWDGPNNKKLLDMMPEVYRDPVYGQAEGNFTNYAAVTGDGMAFPAEGIQFDGNQASLFSAIRKQGQTFVNFTDGTSNSIIVGTVSPEAKIPWMKPVDIVVDDKFPNLGRPGGFSAPFKSGDTTAGVFAFGDGSVRAIRANIAPASFRKLLTVRGGEVIGDDEVPSDNSGAGGPVSPVIEIDFSGKAPIAHWKLEPVPAMDELPEPAPPGAAPLRKD